MINKLLFYIDQVLSMWPWMYIMDGLITVCGLTIFISAILNEKTDLKKIGKILLLCGLPCGLAMACFYWSIPVRRTAYVLTETAVLSSMAAAVSVLWKRDLCRAVSVVCTAGILQASLSAVLGSATDFLAETQLEHLGVILFFGFGTAAPWAVSTFLRKLGLCRPLRRFLEDGQHARTTAVISFLLEAAAESFVLLRAILTEETLAVYNVAAVLLSCLLIGILLYLSAREADTRRIQMQESIIVQQRLYMEHLEEIQAEMQAMLHQYKNTFSSMQQHARQGRTEKIQEALEQMEIHLDCRIGEKIRTAVQLGNIQVLEVKSLVMSKMTKMKQAGIPCSLEVLYPVENVGMDIWDFNRCLGILLDNAQEAAMAHEHPCVELLLLYGSGFLTVRVANPWHQHADVSQMWKEGFSTKAAGRGLGLFSYQRILAQYPDAVPATSWDEHMFVQEFTVAVRGRIRSAA